MDGQKEPRIYRDTNILANGDDLRMPIEVAGNGRLAWLRVRVSECEVVTVFLNANALRTVATALQRIADDVDYNTATPIVQTPFPPNPLPDRPLK